MDPLAPSEVSMFHIASRALRRIAADTSSSTASDQRGNAPKAANSALKRGSHRSASSGGR